MNKNILLPIAKILPLNLTNKLFYHKIIFPFYHCISNNPPPHIDGLYYLKTSFEFEKDVDFLLKNYNIIDLEDLNNFFSGKIELKRKSFLLSFDDGLSEMYDIVAPILRKKGVPATFFVNSDFIDNKKLFFRFKYAIINNYIKNKISLQTELTNHLSQSKILKNNLKNTLFGYDNRHIEAIDKSAKFLEIDFDKYLNEKKPYMSLEQLQELQKQGFTIGSHSRSHPLFSTLSLAEQLEQAKSSIDFVKDSIKPKYNIFAFPFTDDKVKKKFFETLYSEYKIDYTFGTAGIKNDTFQKNIQRIPVENEISLKNNLKIQSISFFLKRLINKSTVVH